MIRKYMDYRRRKELDKMARHLWVDTFTNIQYKTADDATGISHAHAAVTAFYEAFYPNHKS